MDVFRGGVLNSNKLSEHVIVSNKNLLSPKIVWLTSRLGKLTEEI